MMFNRIYFSSCSIVFIILTFQLTTTIASNQIDSTTISLNDSQLSSGSNETNATTPITTLAPTSPTTTTVRTTRQLTTAATTSTSTTLAPTKIRSKTICTCQMSSLEEFVFLDCPSNYKISIYTAYLYDTVREDNCSRGLAGATNSPVSIKEELSNICGSNNCSIMETMLIDLSESKESECLSADIKWTCYSYTRECF